MSPELESEGLAALWSERPPGCLLRARSQSPRSKRQVIDAAADRRARRQRHHGQFAPAVRALRVVGRDDRLSARRAVGDSGRPATVRARIDPARRLLLVLNRVLVRRGVQFLTVGTSPVSVDQLIREIDALAPAHVRRPWSPEP